MNNRSGEKVTGRGPGRKVRSTIVGKIHDFLGLGASNAGALLLYTARHLWLLNGRIISIGRMRMDPTRRMALARGEHPGCFESFGTPAFLGYVRAEQHDLVSLKLGRALWARPFT